MPISVLSLFLYINFSPSGTPYLFLFLKSLGVQPVIFKKAALKLLTELNPQLNATSVTPRLVVSNKR